MIDVTGARERTEADLVDKCVITRDPQGVHDDTFNELDLTYGTPAAGDTSTIYADLCSIAAVATQGRGEQTEGGQMVYRDEYRARVKVTNTVPAIGDVFTLTVSANDESMVGRRFTIIEVLGGTYTVTRRLRMVARKRGPRT